MEFDREILSLTEKFKSCEKILNAIGDENRFFLMIEMMQMGSCGGARVGDIAQKTFLSRPAVSHHLKILKDAGVMKMRKEGTKNYYYFDSDLASMKRLIATLQHAVRLADSLPKRGED